MARSSPAQDRDTLAAQALALLADPGFASLFAPGSRAEVPLVGTLPRNGLAPYAVTGQVDRLLVGASEVLMADYKTNRPAPHGLATVPHAYKRQLALYRALLQRIYPGRNVRAALVFTEIPLLLEIPAQPCWMRNLQPTPAYWAAGLDPPGGHSYVRRPRQSAERLQFERCLMAVGKVSDATFESEVLKASGPVVVDFWAEWCGPCRMIAPALDEIQNAMGEKVKIVKLNVDENPGVASKYGIMSIPTLMIFKNGELASRQVGAAPKAKLEQWISAAV